jgi:hypothetical protein
MLDFFGLFAEIFSYGEMISFVWLYIFSKNYRKTFREKWNEKRVGIETESKTMLISGIIFSILFNALIIYGLVQIALLVFNY